MKHAESYSGPLYDCEKFQDCITCSLNQILYYIYVLSAQFPSYIFCSRWLSFINTSVRKLNNAPATVRNISSCRSSVLYGVLLPELNWFDTIFVYRISYPIAFYKSASFIVSQNCFCRLKLIAMACVSMNFTRDSFTCYVQTLRRIDILIESDSQIAIKSCIH